MVSEMEFPLRLALSYIALQAITLLYWLREHGGEQRTCTVVPLEDRSV